MTNITLGDIETGTIFELNGIKWEKGGWGNCEKVRCFPKMGGVFQHGEKFRQDIDLKTEVNIYSSDEKTF